VYTEYLSILSPFPTPRCALQRDREQALRSHSGVREKLGRQRRAASAFPLDYANSVNAKQDSASLYLAIDQGGHASRALIFDGAGNVVASAHVPVETRRPRAFWVEQDGAELLASVRTAIHQACAAVGRDTRRIGAAGLATQRSSLVCWNRRSGAPLSPVLSWQDTRAAAWLDSFAPRAADVRRRTGLRLSPHYGASKLRWCLDHLTPVQHAHAAGELCCGPLASFLAFGITTAESGTAPASSGAAAHCLADPANASRTLLWNITERDWDAQLLEWFGVPRAVLPEAVPTRHAFGTLTVAGRTLPLSLVTGDQSAALFAFGPPRDEVIYINLGTGAFIQHLSTTASADHPALLRSVVYADRQQTLYALEGTVNGAGSALSWFAQREDLAETDLNVDRWLETNHPVPLFINTVGGLGSPFWAAQIAPHFVGEGNLEACGCAVVESILFLVNTNLAAFRDAGIIPRELVLSGGLAQSDGLCQTLADLSQIPVSRPQLSEATARGLVQLLSHFSLPQATPAVRFAPRLQPARLARQEAWRRALESAIAADGASAVSQGF